jgi:surface polysaccharide O-acyltransferase-like enzyme
MNKPNIATAFARRSRQYAEHRSGPNAGRAIYLDLFKTLLIYGMVTAHVIQLLGLRLGDGAARFSDFVNLISFSGYMLAFGIGIGLSKASRQRSPWQRFKPALVILACYYVSGLAFAVLVSRSQMTADLIIDLLTLRVLFGYSEFLASFFVLYLVIALLRPLLIAIADRPPMLVIAIIVCLAGTALTINQLVPLAGTIVGHTKYASFPLLPYLPWFLIGIRLGRQDGRPGWIEAALALVATAAFGYFLVHTGWNLPERFPPSVLWIVGPALILLIYLIFARSIADNLPLPSPLLAPGRHVLAALIVSNLIIFSIDHFYYKPAHPLWVALAISVGVLAAATLWCGAIDLWSTRSKRPAARR